MLSIFLAHIDALETSKFERLYLNYKDVMYNLAYQILEDKYLAEDAVHNAFMSLTKYMYMIDDPESDRSRNLMFIIARQAAIKIYNQNKSIVNINELSDEIQDDINVESDIELRDFRKKVMTALKNMDPNYSDVLMLSFFYDMPDKEISLLLDISVENVRTRTYRARKKLKKLLWGGPDHD